MKRPRPAEIQYKNMKFLIMDRPTDGTIDTFIEELRRRGARDVVRVCEPSYNTEKLNAAGIQVMDWQFDDGSPPPSQVVDDWVTLLYNRFKEEPGCCVAVHCVAGLGRAPVLVAIALLEGGMQFEDAVALIRERRRGAINARQLTYLEHYRSKSRLRNFRSPLRNKRNGQKLCCIF
ncbi:hypothetical protein ScPMuIL_009721 [Solemya velum]